MGKGKRVRHFRNVIGIKQRMVPKRPDRAHITPAMVEARLAERADFLAAQHQGPARQERPLGRNA